MCYPSGVNLAFVTSWNYLQVSRCFPVSLFMFVRQILGLTANAVGTFHFHFDASISPAPWHGHAAMPIQTSNREAQVLSEKGPVSAAASSTR